VPDGAVASFSLGRVVLIQNPSFVAGGAAFAGCRRRLDAGLTGKMYMDGNWA
jgi:hypothetical protein